MSESESLREGDGIALEKIEFSPWSVAFDGSSAFGPGKAIGFSCTSSCGSVRIKPDGTIKMWEHGSGPQFGDGSFKTAALERVTEFATGLLNSAANLVGEGPPLVLKVSEARILAETQGQLAQAKQERDQALAAYDHLISGLETARKERDQAMESREEMRRHLDAVRGQREELRSQLDAVRKELDDTSKAFAQLKTERDQATERCGELRRQLDGCAVELAEIKKALFEERAELVLLRNSSKATREELEKERETSADLREKLKAAWAEAGEMAVKDTQIGPPSKFMGDTEALKMAAEEAGFRLVRPEHLWELSCAIRETAVQEERLVRAWEAVGGQPEPRATMGMRIVTEKQLTDLVLAAQGVVLDGNHEELERKLEQAWAAVGGEPA